MSDPRIFSESWDYDEGVDNYEGRHPRPPGHRDGPEWDYPDRLRPPEYPFGHASRPNWQPGYVPSATEWQSWFSRKYDTDDPLLSGGPFVPLGGGTLEGPLYARLPRFPNEVCTKAYADSLTPAAGPFVDANGKTPFTGDVTMLGHLQVGGDIYADCGLTVKTDLRVGNTLYVEGYSMMANNLDVNADVTVTNTLYVGPLGAQGYQGACPPGDDETALRRAMWGFYVDPNTGDRIQSFSNGAYNQWEAANGRRRWWGTARIDGPLMELESNGGLVTWGYVNALGGLQGSSLSITGSAGNATINGLVLNPQPGQQDALWINGGAQVNGDLAVLGQIRAAVGNVGGISFADSVVLNATPGQLDALWVNGDCQLNSNIVNVTGTLNAAALNQTSDARLKRDIAPSSVGLTQVRGLKPKTFKRGQGQELGLIAQDVREVLPEAVYGTDTLGVALMPVLTALIGAVQELDRKFEALGR